jgi:hypothetical protein
MNKWILAAFAAFATHASEHRESAMLLFPGGYIAEVHAPASE